MQDTVWGLIEPPGFVWSVIDTDVFQRLRYLRQTGALRFLIPGATHDRFSHSIGTAYLAHSLLDNLAKVQPQLLITEEEHNTVVMAALCHDLGHGPGSHGFDRFMHAIDREWTHEVQSVQLMRHLVDARGVGPALAAAQVDVHVASEMILGSRDKAPPGWKWKGPAAGREFLYDIVSNANSGMDVDKWDYLERDILYTNIRGAFTSQRLLTLSRVVPDCKGAHRLALPETEASNVNNMFTTRYNLHAQAYQHRISRCLELMISEALMCLKDMHVPTTGVPLREAYRHLDVYVKTTDTIMDLALQGLIAAETPDLATAMALFQRVRDRDLWREVGSVTLTPTFAYSTEEVVAELCRVAVDVPSAMFLVDLASINCGKGRFDPMLKVTFYSKHAVDAAGNCVLKIADRTTDYMRPMHFQRRIMRVFAKDDAHVPALLEALQAWAQSALGPHAEIKHKPYGDDDFPSRLV